MERKDIITGQLMLRDSKQAAPGDETGRRIMMVVGAISVPEHIELKGEHKYTIAGVIPNSLEGLYQMIDPDFGRMTETLKEIQFTLFPESGEDFTEHNKGRGLGNLITDPIWRV